MSQPFSEPIAPAQPKQDSYSVSDLALFKSYSREAYRATFGVQAAAFDPSRPVKSWFDSTADTSDPANVALYRVVVADQRGQWSIRQMVLSAGEAATVNIPGRQSYPAYEVAPTSATRGPAGIWPDTLSLRSEAVALLAEMGMPGLELLDEGEGGTFPVNYGNEPRRVWYFMYRGIPYGVGSLLAMKYREGVGAPGHWEVGDTIKWILPAGTSTELREQHPVREIPIRELLPNERLSATFMGPMIVRTDRATAPAAAGFNDADREMLREVLNAVRK
jgi:hypothetical protein